MVLEKIVHHIVQELLGPPNSKMCPAEENVEAICQFFNTIGATASIRNPRGVVFGVLGNTNPGGFPIARPGIRGLMPGMPGMPGTRKMPGMPGIDNDS
ncbi:Eukaryotic translation initiation factor [Arachis hypogaea]|nr:Eukaryotic translation initiation factor [Arachis hypogaea]